MGRGTRWSKEEIEYLESAWGRVCLSSIAKRLGRTESAVVNMVQRMDLGPWMMSGDYVGFQQFMSVLHGVDYFSAASAWAIRLRAAGIPVKRKKRRECYVEVINIKDFWDWAAEDCNRRLIDFSKLEENALGEEPAWVKQKRKIDYACRVKTTPWTSVEDAKLKRMLSQYKYTYTDIASELNRSEGAVKGRIFDLNIKERPLRNPNVPWTKADEKKLMLLYMEGWSFEKIGSQLGRSGIGCRGKIEGILHPEYNKRAYRDRDKREAVV